MSDASWSYEKILSNTYVQSFQMSCPRPVYYPQQTKSPHVQSFQMSCPCLHCHHLSLFLIFIVPLFLLFYSPPTICLPFFSFIRSIIFVYNYWVIVWIFKRGREISGIGARGGISGVLRVYKCTGCGRASISGRRAGLSGGRVVAKILRPKPAHEKVGLG